MHRIAIPAGQAEFTLPYRQPYDWAAIVQFLGARAIPGVEQVQPGATSAALHGKAAPARSASHQPRLIDPH
ncbi:MULTISPECIES: AlkA N-terminal domain-containing protein [Acidiphilium]|uniref:AlkA N-terminal domain-containing protein n=1 Tax=Acidiphilium TaxID=522 RepID=UPI000493D41F